MTQAKLHTNYYTLFKLAKINLHKITNKMRAGVNLQSFHLVNIS